MPDKEKVLIIEDDLALLDIYSQLLTKAGYDVNFSKHGVKPNGSYLIKLLPVSVGYLTRVLQLEHQTLLGLA